MNNHAERLVSIAMKNPDAYVIHFIYVKDDSVCTRMVSPYEWRGPGRFLGLCLNREEVRCFRVERIHQIRLVPSRDVTVPFPMAEVEMA